MNDQITAQLYRVEEPEMLSNGGKKWLLTLENGSQLMTYTWKLASSISQYVGSEFTFECEPPPFEGAVPKVARVFSGGELFWEPAPKPQGAPTPSRPAAGAGVMLPTPSAQQGGGSTQGSWVDTTHPMNVRTALMQATELVKQRVNSSSTQAEIRGLAEIVQEIAMDYAVLLDEMWHNPLKRSGTPEEKSEGKTTADVPIGPPVL